MRQYEVWQTYAQQWSRNHISNPPSLTLMPSATPRAVELKSLENTYKLKLMFMLVFILIMIAYFLRLIQLLGYFAKLRME